LEASKTASQTEFETSRRPEARILSLRFIPDRVQYAVYLLALAVSISTWFIAIRAPLWLDETVSFFLIKGGFAGIMSRRWPDSPAYSCVLWLWTRMMGTGEITLRMLSVVTMLVAVYLLYLAARDLFDWDVAIIAAIVFWLDPIIIFASIDVRPYALAAVAVNASILALVHLRHNDSNWLAALFGLSAACIVLLQLLFAVIVPALAICLVVLKLGDRKVLRRQFSVALIVFAVAFLPVIPRLQYMFHTSGTHVFALAPTPMQLVWALLSQKVLGIFLGTLLLAVAFRRLDRGRFNRWLIFLCATLALVPILTLYALSAGTSIHVFVSRYRLVGVPGIALCWALAVSRIDSRALRMLFCVVLVAVTAFHDFRTPAFKSHSYSWKYALEAAQKNASAENAPVLICSDLPESDYMPMPVGSAIEETGILAPLSYYKLSVPVVALPRALNDEAMRDGSRFVQSAAAQHKRFLAVAYIVSYKTLDWLAKYAAGTYDVHELGVFDRVKVLEFVPRT
jgi:hypothetical protein